MYYNGMLLWGNAYKKHVNKILKIQWRAIRKPYQVILNLFEKYDIRDIYAMYEKELCIFMCES